MSPTKKTTTKSKAPKRATSPAKKKGKAPAKGGAVAKKKSAAKSTRGAAPKKRALAPKRPARKKTKALPGATAAVTPPAENPAAKALAQRIGELCLDKKGKDVAVLDVRGIASYADYVVLASGESERQVTAIADHVQQKLKEERGEHVVGSEGRETGQWVLLDYGDVVAHLFYDEARPHYDLEGLWADAPRQTLS